MYDKINWFDIDFEVLGLSEWKTDSHPERLAPIKMIHHYMTYYYKTILLIYNSL